jgi:DNA polymerase-3 subunit alpha
MPDIDTDFCQEKREKVIEYITQKYGKNNVAQVITFGSLLAKGVIRDVARVLDLSYADADKFAKLIPDKLGITLEEAFNTEPKIKEFVEQDHRYAEVWRNATALEGLKRNAGTHAAGIVISNEELWHKTPLFKPSNDSGTLATQYDGRFLEDVDLIKFDFLGLKTLTVVDNAVKIIKNVYGQILDVTNLPMDDKKVFDLVQTGHTDGIFQIESGGMQNLVSRLKPTTFEDLIAILALYRPGPMESGMLDDFIERKHGRAQITYAFAELEPILAPTYGVIVYQEQVMQIVQTIGGFSLGQADLVRRGMGKKDIKYILEQKVKFAEGAAAKGLDGKKAEELFDLIEKFAGYGFNKSHSAAYAMITYQTAYLKARYPSAFMAALLSSERDNVDKIRKYIDEMKRMGIELAPPSIQYSAIDFTPRETNNKSQILFGLGAIKGIGDAALSVILEARKDSQFIDLADMLSRVEAQKVNKKALESLIKSGSFDEFGYTRAGFLDNIESIVEYTQNIGKLKKDAAFSLFGDDEDMTKMPLNILDKPEMDIDQKLAFEEETLGIYVSGHPLDQFSEQMKELDYLPLNKLDDCANNEEILVVAMVKEAKKKISAKGRPYGILNISDMSGTLELTVFEDALNALDAFSKDEPVCFVCQVENSEGSVRLRAKRVHTIDEAKDFRRKKGYTKKQDVKSEPKQIKEAPKPILPVGLEVGLERDAEFLAKIKDLASKYLGNRPLVLVFKNSEQVVHIPTPFKVSDEFTNALSTLAA